MLIEDLIPLGNSQGIIVGQYHVLHIDLKKVSRAETGFKAKKTQVNALVFLISGLLVPGQLSLLDSVRFASKKAGGSSKNLGGKSPGRRYGFKKQDGSSKQLYPYLCIPS